MERVESWRVGELWVHLCIDECPESPRDDGCNLGTILYTSHHYRLGDKRVEPQEIGRITRSNAIWMPVYAYIHGMVSVSTSCGYPYNDRWDGGQCGIIYVERERALQEHGEEGLQEWAEGVMRAEIETFNQYLQGEVYGFVIEDEGGNVLGSCWGFYGQDYCKQEAEDEARAIGERLVVGGPGI